MFSDHLVTVAKAKRDAVEKQLAQFDRALRRQFGPEITAGGHCLLLGRHYAESNTVYFSLNPGFARDGSPLNPRSSGDDNVPFRNCDSLCRSYVYLRNCQGFFERHPDLGEWIGSRVTSAFLVPWRTRNTSDLYKLNRATGGQVFRHAGDLVRMILRHHQPRILVMAGKSSLTLLNDLGILDSPVIVSSYEGPGGSYQWSRSRAMAAGYAVTVLQIPHFSRANSPVKLALLHQWLRVQLQHLEVKLAEPGAQR